MLSNKRQRIVAIALMLISLSLGITMILRSFNQNIIFFYCPSELSKQQISAGTIIRVGGLVKQNSLNNESQGITSFILTDYEKEILVIYNGILPALFREMQGMVAKGTLKDGTLLATELLAKHDENYMPKEVEQSLKKSGRWQGNNIQKNGD
jgi:cytochrome c-type biogenesis protein CcmE